MKLFRLFLILIFIPLSSWINAQGSKPMQPRTSEERAKITVEYLSKNMSLTREKSGAMVPVFETFYLDISKARSAQDRDAMDKAEKKLETSLRKLLKEPEMKEVKRLLEERKKQRSQYIQQQEQPRRQTPDKN